MEVEIEDQSDFSNVIQLNGRAALKYRRSGYRAHSPGLSASLALSQDCVKTNFQATGLEQRVLFLQANSLFLLFCVWQNKNKSFHTLSTSITGCYTMRFAFIIEFGCPRFPFLILFQLYTWGDNRMSSPCEVVRSPPPPQGSGSHRSKRATCQGCSGILTLDYDIIYSIPRCSSVLGLGCEHFPWFCGSGKGRLN